MMLLWDFQEPVLLLFLTLLLLRWMREYPDDFPSWAVELTAFVLFPVLYLVRYNGNFIYSTPLLMAVLLFNGKDARRKVSAVDWILFFLLLTLIADPELDKILGFIQKYDVTWSFILEEIIWRSRYVVALLFLFRSTQWQGWSILKSWRKVVKVTALGLGILYFGGLIFHYLTDAEFRKDFLFLVNAFQTGGLIPLLSGLVQKFAMGEIALSSWGWDVVGLTFQEIYYRGYLFGAMEKRWGFYYSAVFSSLLFVIGHGYWATHIFLFGLLACWAMKASGSLLPPIFLHVIGNYTITILKILARS